MINMLGFKITSILGSSLSLESFKLDLWVVKLGISVNDFVEVAEKFESL